MGKWAKGTKWGEWGWGKGGKGERGKGGGDGGKWRERVESHPSLKPALLIAQASNPNQKHALTASIQVDANYTGTTPLKQKETYD